MNYTPFRWLAEDAYRVTENDNCRTFVPIEQVSDPSVLSFEDIEIIKKINHLNVFPTEEK